MKIGFIGAGKMAEAMIASFLARKTLAPHMISASDISCNRLQTLKRIYKISVSADNRSIVQKAKVIFLSIKPQQMSEVLAGIAPAVTDKHLVISIAAGRKISTIQKLLPKARCIRVMPNMAALVSEGMSVFCAGASAKAGDKRIAVKLLSCFGKVIELSEKKFDAVTAVSGSGPAFFAYLLDAITDAGVKHGLPRPDALLLAEQTMLGTAKLLIEKKLDPQDLIASVASAKGTTAAGLAVLDKSPVKSVLAKTISAAVARSRELST